MRRCSVRAHQRNRNRQTGRAAHRRYAPIGLHRGSGRADVRSESLDRGVEVGDDQGQPPQARRSRQRLRTARSRCPAPARPRGSRRRAGRTPAAALPPASAARGSCADPTRPPVAPARCDRARATSRRRGRSRARRWDGRAPPGAELNASGWSAGRRARGSRSRAATSRRCPARRRARQAARERNRADSSPRGP